MSKYQLLPPLSEPELAALRDDIAAVGIRVPIDVDENGEVLDGHHRKAVALMLGVECPERVVRGLAEFEKVDYALTVNLARRHLDREARRDLVKKSLLRDAGLADREHARRTGVHHDTVGRIRAELEKLGKLDPQVKRTGGDGKERQLADSASSQTRASNHADVDGDRPRPDPSAAPSDVPGVAPDGAPAEQEESADSPPAVERPQGETGVTSPAAAPQLVDTAIGPMPKDFTELLDRLVPDPNPHWEWQAGFLRDVFAAAKAMRGYTGAEIAEKADDQLRAEFATFVADMDDLLRSVAEAQIAAADNVVPLRRVK